MKTSKIIIAFMFLIVLGGCEKENVSLENIKDEMLAEVNKLRGEGCTCGSQVMPPVAALTWNNKLMTAAENHVKDMQENSNFSHTGSDGSKVSDRVSLTGYVYTYIGENIALGYDTAESVVRGLQNSESHCLNMMDSGFEEVGAAKVGGYWVQTFGKQ